jgi:hypothetical protein
VGCPMVYEKQQRRFLWHTAAHGAMSVPGIVKCENL